MSESVVYFAVRATDGAIKIGTSRGLARRLTELADYQGCGVELLATMPGGARQESDLHTRFRSTRIRARGGTWYTEWFRPSDELTAFIASLPDKPAHVEPAEDD